MSLMHSDMAVKCYQGSHLGAMAVSGVWLVIWAIIVPFSVFWVGRWQTDLHEDLRFSFLFGELCGSNMLSVFENSLLLI